MSQPANTDATIGFRPVVVPRDAAEAELQMYEIGYADGGRDMLAEILRNRIRELWADRPEVDAAAKRLGEMERPR